MKKLLVLSVFLITCFTSVASANLIQNGDFGTGDFTSWVTTDNQFSIQNGWGDYVNHAQFLNSGLDQVGILAQNFYISPETTQLIVSFDFQASFGESGNGNASDPSADFDPDSYFRSIVALELDGDISQGHKFEDRNVLFNTDATTSWTHVEITMDLLDALAETNPNARLVFRWDENEDWMSNAKIDNISVAPVPEPATILLLGSGLLGLGWYERKRKKA